MANPTDSDRSVDEELQLDRVEPPLVLKPLIKMRNSFLWFLIGIGSIFLILSIYQSLAGDGPLSAILFILGGSLMIAGVLARALLRLIAHQ